MALYPDTEITTTNISGSLSDLHTEGSGWYTGSDPGTTWHFGLENPAGDITGQQTLRIEMRSADESYDIEVSTLEIQENGNTVASFSPANVSVAETRTFTWDASGVSDPNAIEVYGETSHTGGGQRANFDLGFVEWDEQLDQTLAATTNQPSNVDPDTATLEGDVTYEGYGNTADVWFDYRQTISETWSQTATQTVSASQAVSETVSVTDTTEYEYRIQAEDATAGVSDTGFEITFETKQTIAGTVSDETDTALDGATVFVIDESDESLAAELTTDASGAFSVNLPAGTYHIAAQYDDGTQHAGLSYHTVGDSLTAGDGGGSGSGANLENADLYLSFDDTSYETEFHDIYEGGLDTRSIVDAPGRPGDQLQVTLFSGEEYGTDMKHYHADAVGSDPTHAYHRYLLRFGPDFEASNDGKLPGFGGQRDTSEGIGGGGANGTGWSARAGWNQPGGDVIGPNDPIPLEYYVYHMDMDGSYGFHDWWDDGDGHFEAARETWYEIEQEIDLGTVNTNDGELRAWVDGDLVYERTDLRFRESGGNDITETWFNVFHGDGAPATVDTQFDDFYIHRDGVP